jgi:triosephosphate isomerase
LDRPKYLIAGNWKMNGLRASLHEIAVIKAGIMETGDCDVAVCPPATLISACAAAANASPLMIGGQDCHPDATGAHTGDISAEMIADVGGKLVIVGHSERRTDLGETDALLRAKALAVRRAGLLCILCIGETEAERRSGKTLEVLSRQLAGSMPEGWTAANLAVAYEPVWAIGTGLTASEDDIAAAHAHIRRELAGQVAGEAGNARILYGGSVKPGNAASILALADVNGVLVGGASLKGVDFLGIVAAVP